MSNIFQKLKSAVQTPERAAEPRLTLAAFGKHPGWDDHLPGIGVETEWLAQAKQTMYVGGIGGQIDSGAWEKLETSQRIEGFDHTFLWLKGGDSMLGRLWSSTDGKGRAKYPMILCLHGERVSPALLVRELQPGLEGLREACLAATAAEQVTRSCEAARDRLRAQVGSAPAPALDKGLTPGVRRQFLEHRDFMPDRLGLLRVLHELGGLADKTPGGSAGRSRHLRVPMGVDSPAESLLLWGDFFRRAVSAKVSVLLISRGGSDWLDAIIGEPEGSNFFCLQASLKVLPLTTEIPYDLSPELKQRWVELEAKFLNDESPTATKIVGPTPSEKTGSVPPEPSSSPPVKQQKWIVPVLAGLALVALALGYLVFHKSAPNPAIVSQPVPPQPRAAELPATNQPPASAPATNSGVEKYEAALKQARAALDRKDYTTAISQAGVALGFKTNDSAAMKLKAGAESSLAQRSQQQKYDAGIASVRAANQSGNYSVALALVDDVLAAKPGDPATIDLKREVLAQQKTSAEQASRQTDFAAVLAAGRAAYDQKDFASALKQSDQALALKTNDLAAAKLKADAQAQLNQAAAAAADRQANFDAVMKAAHAALTNKEYAEAIAQSNVALGLQTNDPAALKLKSDAKAALDRAVAAAEARRKFEVVMGEARAALDRKEYSNAVVKADAALALQAADASALKLKDEAVAAQQAILVQATQEQGYQQALAVAQSALEGKDYTKAIAQADAALIIRTGDASALTIKKSAVEGKDLQEVKGYINSGEFEKAKALCASHAGTPAFDELLNTLGGKVADKYETEFEVYLVHFGLLVPKNAKSAQAQGESKWMGELPIQQRDLCFREVEVLRAAFKASGRLDAARDKKLNDLKKAINDHL